MSMRVLVLNSGSSSLKFRVCDFAEAGPPGEADPGHAGRAVLGGRVTGIGGEATLSLEAGPSAGDESQRLVPDHARAARWVFESLQEAKEKVTAVGHRVVHGGERFRESVRIDEQVLAELNALNELAPLHNPVCLAGIQSARVFFGGTMPMVAVFDTAFHRSLPPVASLYALPQDLMARHRIRRYGFHGIAHASLAAGYSAFTGRPLEQVRLITLQLGNGCSVTAILDGRSVDTSMGFTPLEGLVMGTRCGDLDPTVVGYLARREGVSTDQVEQWLNERSGLLGLSGLSHDMRTLIEAAEQQGDSRAALAIELFCYRVRKYLGAYLAVLGGADAVIFGGGIGERAPTIRARICAGMDWCGLRLDPDRNAQAVGLLPGQGARISRDGAGLPAFVVAADEETWIARETVRCLVQGGMRA